MPSTTAETKTAEERIAALEQQVGDLAAFVGRVTCGVFGAKFDEHDPGDDELLVWKEEVSDLGTEDEEPVGWWVYKADLAAEMMSEEASDDAS